MVGVNIQIDTWNRTIEVPMSANFVYKNHDNRQSSEGYTASTAFYQCLKDARQQEL
jgi:hypothetical protein